MDIGRMMRFVCVCVGLLFAVGCEPQAETTETQAEVPADDSQDPAERAQALIESGNQAYAAGDFELAARRFGAAAVVKDDDPAAYFGLGMSLSRLGRDDDARLAYTRARKLVQEQREAAQDSASTDEDETP